MLFPYLMILRPIQLSPAAEQLRCGFEFDWFGKLPTIDRRPTHRADTDTAMLHATPDSVLQLPPCPTHRVAGSIEDHEWSGVI